MIALLILDRILFLLDLKMHSFDLCRSISLFDSFTACLLLTLLGEIYLFDLYKLFNWTVGHHDKLLWNYGLFRNCRQSFRRCLTVVTMSLVCRFVLVWLLSSICWWPLVNNAGQVTIFAYMFNVTHSSQPSNFVLQKEHLLRLLPHFFIFYAQSPN